MSQVLCTVQDSLRAGVPYAGVQLVFYLLYGNMQVAFAFLLSCFFSSTKTANIGCRIWLMGSGLVAFFLLESLFVKGRWWVTLVHFIPTFGAFRCDVHLS